MNYLSLYDVSGPPTDLINGIPSVIFELCKPQFIINNEYDFEEFKDSLWSSEFVEEWAWFNTLGKGTKRRLSIIVDEELPEGLRYRDRTETPLDYQSTAEFFVALMEIIRDKELVGSQPYYRQQGSIKELYFAKEVEL